MSLFGNSKKNEQLAELFTKVKELENRWNTFLIKLEEKADELIEGIRTEGKTLWQDGEDAYHQTYHRFKSSMQGQLRAIYSKARNTYEDQIRYNSLQLATAYEDSSLIREMQYRCDAVYHAWEERIREKEDLAVTEAEAEDLELKYQEILAEHAAIKDKFSCTQCGGKLVLDKIYFITTYIKCDHCQTQNTFEPSTRAKGLEGLAKPLAEQRCQHLYDEYRLHVYHPRYEDTNKRAKKEVEVSYYQQYLRAVFDEVHKIVPDLKVQNEKFYERLMEEYRKENL